MQNSDNELIDLIQKGNEAAFEALYDRYARPVMGVVYRIVQNEAVAAEVVQETFIRIWDQVSRYDPEKAKFSTWMFGIARNIAIDRYRRQKVRPEAAQSEAEADQFELTPADTDQVEEVVGIQIERETVQQAVLSLPDEQRVVIELAYFHGLTRQEIAEQQGIALGTVHSRARLAMKKLESWLEDQPQGVP